MKDTHKYSIWTQSIVEYVETKISRDKLRSIKKKKQQMNAYYLKS